MPDDTLKALVYRSHAVTCEDCPDAVKHLLESFPTSKISTSYVGPQEDVKLDKGGVFADVDIFAIPGGSDLPSAWEELKPHHELVRNFVKRGGRYLGFCLGAYLAGFAPDFDLRSFDLLPSGVTVMEEVSQQHAQVNTTDDSILQIDWAFQSGPGAATTLNNRWVYFQEGPTFGVDPDSAAEILGRYSSNKNVSSVLSKFGDGWVGGIGFHPEAEKSWYDDDGFSNPDGIKFDIGYDFINATLNGS